jgi:hypothetical protein
VVLFSENWRIDHFYQRKKKRKDNKEVEITFD